MFKVFSGVGAPRPDLVKHDRDGAHKVDEDDKTNRTQPNNTPTPPKPPSPTASKLSFSAKALQKASGAAKKSEAVLSFNSNDWVFTQATAVCSVPVEEDGYTIKPEGLNLINDNGNSFKHKDIQKYHHTFLGAHNFVDHIQDPAESRGVVIDSVMRKLDLKNGEYTIYVDLLIATSKRRDAKWAAMIESGEVSFLSMGCNSSAVQCSRCGHVSFSEEEDCDHCTFNLGLTYYDKNGIKRRISQIVTDHMNEEDGDEGIFFEEISYLSVDPAFVGAVRSHLLELEPDTEVSVVVPRETLQREAFQVHKAHIKGII